MTQLLDTAPARRRGKTSFTAVVAANDLIALGALQVRKGRGISVPEQVSLIGHNDMPLLEQISPPLTSVRIQHYEERALTQGADARAVAVAEMAGADLTGSAFGVGIDANLVAFWAILAQRVEAPALAEKGAKHVNDLTPEDWETLRQKLGGSFSVPSTDFSSASDCRTMVSDVG